MEKLMHKIHQGMQSIVVIPAVEEHGSPNNKNTMSEKGVGGTTEPSSGTRREDSNKDGSLSHRQTSEGEEEGSKDRGEGDNFGLRQKCSTFVMEEKSVPKEKGETQRGPTGGMKFKKKALQGKRKMQ
jgi:hypothetical protein